MRPKINPAGEVIDVEIHLPPANKASCRVELCPRVVLEVNLFEIAVYCNCFTEDHARPFSRAGRLIEQEIAMWTGTDAKGNVHSLLAHRHAEQLNVQASAAGKRRGLNVAETSLVFANSIGELVEVL